jgi:hypothetical protein
LTTPSVNFASNAFTPPTSNQKLSGFVFDAVVDTFCFAPPAAGVISPSVASEPSG